MEKASEIIARCNREDKIDLFEHFVRYFNVKGYDRLGVFATMCGYPIVKGTKI
jgi:hypothetical protein